MGITETIDSFRQPDGQPKLWHDDVRIALDVRLAEPDNPQRDGCVAGCPANGCSRVAFRNVGDNPWVECVCGRRFNTNYSHVGNTPWPWPKDGKLIVEGDSD